MGTGERKLAETPGEFVFLVEDGTRIQNPSWQQCRIIVSNRRLLLVTANGKQTIQLDDVRLDEQVDRDLEIPDRFDLNGATRLWVNDSFLLVDGKNSDLTTAYCRAFLHDQIILAKHPVNEVAPDGEAPDGDSDGEASGGEPASWSKARFRPDGPKLRFGLPNNRTVTVSIDEIESISAASERVSGETRPVLRITVTDYRGKTVQTHLAGNNRQMTAMQAFIEGCMDDGGEDADLSTVDKQILTALYSGVSPFDIPGIVGVPIDEVEESYQHLIEMGALEKIRERTEVELNDHGRNLASGVMAEDDTDGSDGH